jgi:DNA-binding NarL/FixJ family response regulator
MGVGVIVVRIALVDDHPLVLQGMAALLAGRPDFEVVYQGADLSTAVGVQPRVDCLLLDLDLGGSFAESGLVAQALDAGTAVLVVSALASPSAIRRMLSLGVAGFVSKAEPSEVLLNAIDAALEGESWTSTQAAFAIFSDSRCPDLSKRERRVLMLYASGLTLDSVARTVGISPNTAKTYLTRVRAKYAVVGRPIRDRVDLYRAARHDGLID